ncbi:hypothetical protein KEM52_000159 [Ascosphaera acerosa]|nr:hypothetical protein KEM52_000159 [Ascosphaera acerosa]
MATAAGASTGTPAVLVRRSRNDSAGMGLSISPNTLSALGASAGTSGNDDTVAFSVAGSSPQSPGEAHVGRPYSGDFSACGQDDSYQLIQHDDGADDEDGGDGLGTGARNADGGMISHGGGLGNLADELAEAWDDEDEDGNQAYRHTRNASASASSTASRTSVSVDGDRRNGLDIGSETAAEAPDGSAEDYATTPAHESYNSRSSSPLTAADAFADSGVDSPQASTQAMKTHAARASQGHSHSHSHASRHRHGQHRHHQHGHAHKRTQSSDPRGGGHNLGHRKTGSGRSLYDGSDYGNDSDFEEVSSLITPALEQRMTAVDNLARLSIAESRAGGDQVIQRMIDGLQDLGNQSKVETSATRLITAHIAIATHLEHQTRALQTLVHPLLYSHLPPLSEPAIDELVTMIDDLLPLLPTPNYSPISPSSSVDRPPSSGHEVAYSRSVSPSARSSRSATAQSIDSIASTPAQDSVDPLESLRALLAQTTDITQALRLISDGVHESRQLSSTASRRLKNVRELVADIRREDQVREEGAHFIDLGDWDRRLAERRAGQECRSVVGGFEEVCRQWSERLFGSGPSAPTAPAPTATTTTADGGGEIARA